MLQASGIRRRNRFRTNLLHLEELLLRRKTLLPLKTRLRNMRRHAWISTNAAVVITMLVLTLHFSFTKQERRRKVRFNFQATAAPTGAVRPRTPRSAMSSYSRRTRHWWDGSKRR